jgi:hypothetical protein
MTRHVFNVAVPNHRHKLDARCYLVIVSIFQPSIHFFIRDPLYSLGFMSWAEDRVKRLAELPFSIAVVTEKFRRLARQILSVGNLKGYFT